ncbi:MAG: HPr family phosphocarrier protein [Pirellulaceae bacterium]|nr:HPr family phosphocarrier protein [Pirellulaceae bacterium]
MLGWTPLSRFSLRLLFLPFQLFFWLGFARMSPGSVEKSVTLVNPQGFHARPAHMFMTLASKFSSQVEILKGNEVINGKSILDLLTLGAGNGTTLCLRVSGDDAQAAAEALSQLIESGFGEVSDGPIP